MKKNEQIVSVNIILEKPALKCCSKCITEKNINDFLLVYGCKKKDGTRKQRYHSQCKECRYLVCKKWHDKNEGYGTIKKKEWEEKNKEHILEYRKRYNKENADRVRKWKKDWDERNSEELTDCYVILTLSRRTGQNAKFLRQYPQLIETQRLLLKTYRLCKTLQN